MTPLRNWIGHEPSARCVLRHQSKAARRWLQQPADRQRHRVLDVVPRIGVAAVEPGQRAGGLLCRGDRLRGLPALRRRQHAGYAGNVSGQQRHTTGFRKYSATLLPISGFSSDSAVRVSHGRYIMSHTSNLW